MLINISNRQRFLKVSPKKVRAIVQAVILNEGETCDEVSIHFLNTKTMCQMHADFFDDPSPTDCMSFPLDDKSSSDYRVLGDVVVCPETAVTYAKTHQTDHYQELTLYIVHGLLHLMGYDDIRETDRKKMRAAEKRHMAKLEALQLILKE